MNAKIEETIDIFNDMGFMQAIDLITAIEAVRIVLRENGLFVNEHNMIGYGHSHGAFLLHLVNRLAPHLFSAIIDNSAWIEPVYLSYNRVLYQSFGSMSLQIEFDYLAKQIILDKKALNLAKLYSNFNNEAEIIVYQGTNDNLVDHHKKKQLFSRIPNATFFLIDDSLVDGRAIKSNSHGLDADFLELFDKAYRELKVESKPRIHKKMDTFTLSKTTIHVDYSNGLPLFQVSTSM